MGEVGVEGGEGDGEIGRGEVEEGETEEREGGEGEIEGEGEGVFCLLGERILRLGERGWFCSGLVGELVCGERGRTVGWNEKINIKKEREIIKREREKDLFLRQ